jgi:4-hydroxybenzoate polyprenyltransferase
LLLLDSKLMGCRNFCSYAILISLLSPEDICLSPYWQALDTKHCLDSFKEWLAMIKIEHTVFALPFALLSLILGAMPGWPSFATTIWTVLAFAGARSAAMTLNRLIDAEIDATNPRTYDRAIPRGRISKKQALILAVLSFALMLFAAAKLPPLCLALSPIAVIWLSIYSYTKRFTWLCHFMLGASLGGAALGGWIATGAPLTQVAPWLLALAVTTWVAGFDIIYACQDIEIDKAQHLYSFPAVFGITAALVLSSALHVVTVAALAAVGAVLHLGAIFWAGVLLATAMLAWEHSLVKPKDLSKLDAAFFDINGYVSVGLFICVLADRLARLV